MRTPSGSSSTRGTCGTRTSRPTSMRTATASSASMSPTSVSRRAASPTASCPATAWPTFRASSACSTGRAGTASTTSRSSRTTAPSGWPIPTRSGTCRPRSSPARPRRLSCLLGAALIERVCVVGAGGDRQPLRRPPRPRAEVDVLCRREEHARALNAAGLRVSGRTSSRSSCAPPPIPPSFGPRISRSSPRRRPSWTRLPRHLEDTGRARR